MSVYLQLLPGLHQDRSVSLHVLGDSDHCVYRWHHAYQPVLHGLPGRMLLLPLVWTRAAGQASEKPPQTVSVNRRNLLF